MPIGLFFAFYIIPLWIYVVIYLFKNRYTYFLEGMSWPPLRPFVGFYIGLIRGCIWPYFFISYLFNKSKKKENVNEDLNKSVNNKTNKLRNFLFIIISLVAI